MSRRQRIVAHYEPRVHPERASHDILDWASAEAQHARFAALARQLRPLADVAATLSLLDVGCGLADLHDFLAQAGLPVAYTGCDITPAVVQEAQRRHPGLRLLHGDPFSEPLFHPASFDVTFASGLFNLDLGNNHDFLDEAVPQLVALSRQLAVINLLHVRTPQRYDHCHYYDPDDICRRFSALPCEIRIDDGYLANDFTVTFVKREKDA